MRPQSRRYRRRRARLIVLTIAVAVLLVGSGAVLLGLVERTSGGARVTADRVPSGSPTPSASSSPPPSPSTSASRPSPPADSVPTSFPQSGPATWKYAPGQGPVLGTAGAVRRFRVAVETNIAIEAADFAAKAEQALGDARSWIAGGQYRLQRVPGNAAAEFTIYLATHQTSTRMCAAGGLDSGGYTSCRTPGHVIINLDRWYRSVPDYANAHTPLDTYRLYVINHETGHQLGHGHELCPGKGRPAPVMEQQTLGLHGCTANPWPYLDGKRYAGPAGAYGNNG